MRINIQKKDHDAIIISGPTGSGVQKSHMGDKIFTEVTARNLGYAPAVINQESLKEFDEKLRSLKKKQLSLIKNKI